MRWINDTKPLCRIQREESLFIASRNEAGGRSILCSWSERLTAGLIGCLLCTSTTEGRICYPYFG